MLTAAASVSIRDAILVAILGGSVGSLVGGLVTLRVAHVQLRGDTKRQWIEVAAGAYAGTLAVAGGFSPLAAEAIANHRHATGQPPESLALIRQRASDALADLERTSVLSDDPRVQAAAEHVSRTLREMDRAWGDLIDWRGWLFTNTAESAAYKSAAQQVDRLNFKLDEYLADLYGNGGAGDGSLAELRDAIRSTRSRPRQRLQNWHR